MSAFLLSNDHLSMIMTWAIHEGGLGELTPQEWFNEFYLENVQSLQYRYPNIYQELIEHSRYLPDFNAIRPRALKKEIAIAILKFINCWEYQSCQHHFDSSTAPWRMMAQIKELALQISGYESQEDNPNFYKHSPVYELAPWEYSRQEWKAFKAEVINLKALPTA
jgi:hypothetical protein